MLEAPAQPTPPTFQSDPLAFLTQLGNGQDHLFFPLGRYQSLLINSPSLINWLFTSRSVGRGRFFKLFARFIGNGLLASEGEPHLKIRRVMQTAFTRETLPIFMRVMAEETKVQLEQWPTNTPLDLLSRLNRLSYRVSARVIFGMDQIFRDEEGLAEVINAGSGFLMGRAPDKPLELVPHKGRRYHPLVMEALEYIFDHWQPTPIVRVLQGLDEQERYDQTLTLLFASLETSAASITYLFYMLGQHPQIQSKLEQEVRSHTPFSVHDIFRMPYLQHTVSETLRMFPVGGWFNTREALEDTEIEGIVLKKGTPIVASSWITHRDARFFPNPLEFRPERFYTAATKGTYFPFGGGVHLCLGSSLGLNQTAYLAGAILSKFDLEFELDNLLTPQITLSLTPMGKMGARVQLAAD